MALTLEKYSIFSLLIILLPSAYWVMSQTITMSDKHEQWMAHYGRTYESKEEKVKRLKIFNDNVEFIKKFNQVRNQTYKLGINEFADLTKKEFLATHGGNAKPLPPRLAKTSFKYENVSLADVPPSLDWRVSGAVTPVKNQGRCGSCWAFAPIAAVEGITQIKTGVLASLSEQQMMDCDGQPDGCGGGYLAHAYDYVISNGLTSDTNYPYNGEEQACSIPMGSPVIARISSYESTPYADETALLQAVVHQPVSVAVDPSLLQLYKSGIISGDCGTELRHAVTVVGYGVSEQGMNYWIFKNSWGENWGEGGFGRIQRDSGTPEGMCGIAMGASYPNIIDLKRKKGHKHVSHY